MMARTQILKDIRPNIFLCVRKVFGILFFITIHFFSANVKNPVEEVESLMSDSIALDQLDSVPSDQNIYTTSGTTIVDLDHTVNANIVVVDTPKTKNRIVKKTTPKKLVVKEKSSDYVTHDHQDVIQQVYSSSQNDLFFSVGESRNKAVVPSQISHFKAFDKPVNNFGEQILEDLSLLVISVFCNQNLTSEFQGLISGRAPPFIV